MAKSKGKLSEIFKSTERKAPAPPAAGAARQDVAPASGRTVSVGVGLKESEVVELDQLAAGVDVKRNALMGWVLRRFLADVRAGRLDLAAQMEETTTRRLRNP